MKKVFSKENWIMAVQWITQVIGTWKDGKKYCVEVKEHRNTRSNDANRYAWKLLTLIAEKLSGEAQGGTAYSPDDIYLMMLKKYGQGDIVKVPNRAVDNFKRTWKYCEEHERLWDEKAVYYRFWVGSSNYNTKEMSDFINGIVAECNQLGIETKAPDELESMCRTWGAA